MEHEELIAELVGDLRSIRVIANEQRWVALTASLEPASMSALSTKFVEIEGLANAALARAEAVLGKEKVDG